jgi:hypothetical protein
MISESFDWLFKSGNTGLSLCKKQSYRWHRRQNSIKYECNVFSSVVSSANKGLSIFGVNSFGCKRFDSNIVPNRSRIKSADNG